MQISKLALTALIATLAVAPARAEIAPHQVPALRDAAREAYRSRDPEQAVPAYERLTEANPDFAEAWFGLSRAWEWANEPGKAIAAAERADALGYIYTADLSYRLARLQAAAGNEQATLNWLGRALARGYEERPEIQHDDAFAALRDNREFRRLAGVLPDGIEGRNQGLRFDIDYLVEEAQRMHAGPARPAFADEFTHRARELRESVPDLSDSEVYTAMMGLVALLGDGHSAIYGPDPDTPLELSPAVLPLKFYWFAEGLYVVDGIGEAAQFAGLRVERIDGRPPLAVLGTISTLRGVDNSMTWKWLGPQFYLGRLEMLEFAGVTASDEGIELTLVDANGEVNTKRFRPGPHEIPRKLRPSPAMTADVPLYLTDVDTPYWTRPLPEHNALYFQFNQVRNADSVSLSDFAAELAGQLDSGDFDALIVDVRHNNGGNNSLLKPLVKAMIVFEQAAPSRRLFVITGRNTFSAAQNFIARVERWTDAIFVGEPSASSPNFTGEETNLLLPWSRVRGSISTRYWQESSPMDDRQWIAPAIPLAPTAADYFSGRDAALEAILALLP